MLVCAVFFVGWAGHRRMQRVETVTQTDAADAVIDPASPTGYTGGKRWLIAPEQAARSYQWIAETEQMLAQHTWRVRRIDYENAPFGRDVHAASAGHWWLALLAWADHAASGRPLPAAVEHAALWADPLLQLLLLAVTTWFVARQFGGWAAALFAAGMAVLYPFAGGFLPGAPDDRGLARMLALWSVLPLLAAVAGGRAAALTDPAQSRTRTRKLFLLGGAAGGLGLWLGIGGETPVLAGLALGGAVAMGLGRGALAPLPWRWWALGGAATSLVAYLVEYFPAPMSFQLEVNHPLFGVAWLGLGELLAQGDAWRIEGKFAWSARRALSLLLAVIAMAALPAAMRWTGTRSPWSGDLASGRLTFLPNGAVADSFWSWIVRDGLTAAAFATCVPLVLALPAFWLLARRRTGAGPRAALALALGPVLVAVPLAWRQLAWWNALDALLLAAVIAVTVALAAPGARRLAWGWTLLAGLAWLPGIFQLWPLPAGNGIAFTRLELQGLINRELAHWLADRAAGATVFTPPDLTASLGFHGGLRGIGTANWENRDGLQATVRLATATTADEAQNLIRQRGIRFLVLPSWDQDLDAFARWTLRNPEDAFIMALHHCALPPWLRPLPYPLPQIAGFENQSVVVLEVTDETNRAAALSRLAEYFVETGQMDLATATGELLQRYPAFLGALIALAEVDKARADADGFARTLAAITGGLDNGLDRRLPWDRRVSLATVLALGGRDDLAREQVRQCLAEIDAARIRSLTIGSLYHLQTLARAYGLPIADPGLRALALRLLPAELRARLAAPASPPPTASTARPHDFGPG